MCMYNSVLVLSKLEVDLNLRIFMIMVGPLQEECTFSPALGIYRT